MGVLDRYGGAESWDRHCDERDRAYDEMRGNATCAECAYGSVFDCSPAVLGALDRMLASLAELPGGVPPGAEPTIENARRIIAEECEVWVCVEDAPIKIDSGSTPVAMECDRFEPR